MEQTIQGIISDIRVFLYGGVLTLPLTIAGTMLILGLFTANYAILFFLLGFLILTPLLSWILNEVGTWVFAGKSWNPFKAKTSDICKIIIPFTTRTFTNAAQPVEDKSVISSIWMAMVVFFIGYIFTNALELFNRESPEVTLDVKTSNASDIESKVVSRKSQAVIAMISILIFTIIVLGFRYYTGCESILGMVITTLIFGFLGNGWYRALSSVGQDRLSDLFGIANRLLSPGAISNAPIACVPVKA